MSHSWRHRGVRWTLRTTYHTEVIFRYTTVGALPAILFAGRQMHAMTMAISPIMKGGEIGFIFFLMLPTCNYVNAVFI